MSLLLLYCLHYLILLVVTFSTVILYRTQKNDHWMNLEYQFLSLTHTNTDYHINHSSQHSEASTPTALEPWPWNPKLTLAWRRVLCRMPACHNPVRLRLLDHCSFQPFRIEKLVLKKKKLLKTISPQKCIEFTLFISQLNSAIFFFIFLNDFTVIMHKWGPRILKTLILFSRQNTGAMTDFLSIWPSHMLICLYNSPLKTNKLQQPYSSVETL